MTRLSDGSGVLVSIHLTSNRPANVVRLFDNLEATAADPRNVEVCIKIDDFDRPMNELMAREAARRPFRIRYISTPLPGGFWGLWTALNDLIAVCDPDAYFLVNFNDEMSFQEPGWDLALKRYIGFFPDHIFRLRTSRFRLRNYRDWWECGFAPETSAFTTKRWIDIQGNWNACIGPDTFQQTVAFWLSRANWPGQFQYNRDVPIHDIKIGGEGAGLGMTEDQWRRWSRAAIRNWRHIMSRPIQMEANRRARLIQAHLFASQREMTDVEVRDNAARQTVEMIDTRPDAAPTPLARFPYRLSRARIGLTNWWRGFHYYYYGGGGPDVRRQWRHHQFTYLGLRYAFLLDPFRWVARKWTGLRFTRNLCDGGLPFASGHDALPAFLPDTQSWWTSPERGIHVKGTAHIGYFFAEPVHVRRIVLVQTTNHPFRQDRVRIERSVDGGTTWRRVRAWNGKLGSSRCVLRLLPSGPAQSWRLVAAGDNATTDLHAWTPIHIEMQAAHSWIDTLGRVFSAARRRAAPARAAPAIIGAPDLSESAVDAETLARFDPDAMNALLAGPEPMRLVEAAEAAIRIRPDDPMPHLLEGHAYMRLGRRDLARIAYERARDRGPEDREIVFALACLVRAEDGADAARPLVERLYVDPAEYTVESRNVDAATVSGLVTRYGCAVLKGAVDADLAIRLHRDALRGIYAINDRAWRTPEERWRGSYPLSLLARPRISVPNRGPEAEPSALERIAAPLRDTAERILGPGRGAPAADRSEIFVDCADSLETVVRFTQDFYGRPTGRSALLAWVPLVRAGEEAPGRAPIPVVLRNRFPADHAVPPPELVPDLRLAPGDAVLQCGRSLARSWSHSEMIAPLVAAVVRWR